MRECYEVVAGSGGGVPIVELSGGCLVDVHGLDGFVLVDWDNVAVDVVLRDFLLRKGYIRKVSE